MLIPPIQEMWLLGGLVAIRDSWRCSRTEQISFQILQIIRHLSWTQVSIHGAFRLLSASNDLFGWLSSFKLYIGRVLHMWSITSSTCYSTIWIMYISPIKTVNGSERNDRMSLKSFKIWLWKCKCLKISALVAYWYSYFDYDASNYFMEDCFRLEKEEDINIMKIISPSQVMN